jgi:ABC-2 type transport system ATP-binding protein
MIRAEQLTRSFNGTLAVDRISFHVEPGEVFGFLGHNGAGKTTTIRMLTGQLRPTEGWATISGYDVVHDRAHIKPMIGVVFEYQNLYDRMTGRENLRFFAELHGVDGRRVESLLALVGLAERGKDKVKTYSNGMRQRLVVARALLNQPSVLFMDEPTRGLDPTSARDIRATISEMGRQGTTVFLTTHYMEEADQLCKRVAFISEGQIIALDTPQALKLRYGQRQVTVLLRDDSRHELSLDQSEDAAQLADWMEAGQVLTVHSQEATLEEVFIQLAGRSLQ